MPQNDSLPLYQGLRIFENEGESLLFLVKDYFRFETELLQRPEFRTQLFEGRFLNRISVLCGVGAGIILRVNCAES